MSRASGRTVLMLIISKICALGKSSIDMMILQYGQIYSKLGIFT